jgi:hypothetical protein
MLVPSAKTNLADASSFGTARTVSLTPLGVQLLASISEPAQSTWTLPMWGGCSFPMVVLPSMLLVLLNRPDPSSSPEMRGT